MIVVVVLEVLVVVVVAIVVLAVLDASFGPSRLRFLPACRGKGFTENARDGLFTLPVEENAIEGFPLYLKLFTYPGPS